MIFRSLTLALTLFVQIGPAHAVSWTDAIDKVKVLLTGTHQPCLTVENEIHFATGCLVENVLVVTTDVAIENGGVTVRKCDVHFRFVAEVKKVIWEPVCPEGILPEQIEAQLEQTGVEKFRWALATLYDWVNKPSL